VEVELPLIQAAWPSAALLPVEVPLIDDAGAIGRETAQRILSSGRSAVFLASSDLTHYGPAYRFMPAGVGIHALQWAKENDRRLLRLVTDLAIDEIVMEVRTHHNACGGGAIAAMLSAVREAGASRATVLRHANSYETLAGLVRDDPTNAVGYAAVVVE
jgi:AmmeMemoRadiSam system protein B